MIGQAFLCLRLTLLELIWSTCPVIGQAFLCLRLTLLELIWSTCPVIGQAFLCLRLTLLELIWSTCPVIGQAFLCLRLTLLELIFSDLYDIECSSQVAVMAASGRKRILRSECTRVNLIPRLIGVLLLHAYPNSPLPVFTLPRMKPTHVRSCAQTPVH